MKREIIQLLLEQEVISEEIAEELQEIDNDKLVDSIKEFALKQTEKIKSKKIQEHLETTTIGKTIYCFPKAYSTNTLAKYLANKNAEDGTIVIAEVQTKARGRSSKKWESPKGGIWLSMILRPNLPPSKASLITLVTGIAVAKTLKSFGVDAKIKWPNDVLINGKKISGILTEASATLNNIDYIVVGVGIDTNLKIDDFNDKYVKSRITTLNEELGEDIDENEFIAKFLKEFEEVYDLYKKEEFESILNEWRILSDTIGKYVEISQSHGRFKYGYAVGINKEGCLIIEEADGKLEKIISGECRTKGER